MSGRSVHRFGALALERGLIQPSQLEDALAHQRQDPARQLGEVLVSLGYLPSERLSELLKLQANRREAETPGDPLIGELLGGCLILSVLGQGVSGRTYRGRHLSLDRDVAVKVLEPKLASDQRVVARFLREARTVGRLEHPGLVTVFDLGHEGERRFIVMQLVEGRSLAQVLEDDGPLTPLAATRLAIQIARALQAAHAVGVVHRDVKPANVLVRRDGAVKLTDFGLARVADQVSLDRGGEVVGTPLYMSPEQALGEEVGSPADQYALGVLLYQTLTGDVPFRGSGVVEVLRQQVSSAPPPLPDTVPAPLATIVLRLLAKSPADRYADCRALARALRGVLRRLDDEFDQESSEESQAMPRSRPTPEPQPERATSRAHLEALVVKVLLGDVAQALTDLERLEPPLASSLAERIFATLWQVGRVDELAELSQAAARWPGAALFVARALNAKLRPEEALSVLTQADRSQPDVLTEEVMAQLALGHRGEALRALEGAAAQLEPALLARVAELRCDLFDDLIGAAAVLGRLAVLQPSDSAPRRQQGLLLLDEDLPDEAEAALDDAVRRDPLDVRSWTLLGWARERQDDREASVRAYRTALELEPERHAVRISLARLLDSGGQREEARELVESGLVFDGDHPGLLALQGELAP